MQSRIRIQAHSLAIILAAAHNGGIHQLNDRLSFSRKITSVNYDPETETLEIGFSTGKLYAYAKAKHSDLFFDQKILR